MKEKVGKSGAVPGARRVGGPGEKGTRASAVTSHARAAQVAGAAGVVRTAVFNLSKNPIMGKSWVYNRTVALRLEARHGYITLSTWSSGICLDLSSNRCRFYPRCDLVFHNDPRGGHPIIYNRRRT